MLNDTNQADISSEGETERERHRRTDSTGQAHGNKVRKIRLSTTFHRTKTLQLSS